MNPDQQFRLSIHAAFTDKPGKGEHGRLETSQPWQPKQFTLQRLLAWVKAGHAWIAGVSTDGRRAGDCIEGAELLVLDIDGDITIEKFWELGAVKRHCLATYTSVSHQSGKRIAEGKPCDDSYRAIFSLGKFVTDRTIYRQAHYELEAALGIELSDHAGQDPERLWYGATTAQIQLNPDATDLPWDLLENAELESRTQRDRLAQAERRAAAVTDSDRSYDIARLRWVIPQLAPSVHGGGSYGYQDYWFQMLAGCASDWDSLADVFTEWHERGEHSTGPDRQQLNSRRISRVRGKSPARIFEFAKEQIPGYPGCLPEAIKALNPQRQRRKTSISSSFHPYEAEWNLGTGGTQPPAAPLTPSAPSRAIASEKPEDPKLPRDPSAALNAPEGFDEALEALYILRTTGRYIGNQDGKILKPSAEKRIDALLVSDIMKQPLFNREREQIDELLLCKLRGQLGLDLDDPREIEVKRIKPGEHTEGMQFLIPDWILQGTDHLIYGPPGSGKTQLALHLARAANGDPRTSDFLDSGPLNHGTRWGHSRTLIIESDMQEMAKPNLISMMNSFGWPSNPDLYDTIDFFYQEVGGEDPLWQMNLKGILRLHKTLGEAATGNRPYTLVVIDSIKAVCPDRVRVGHDSFLAYFRTVNSLVRKHNAALVWLHHSAPETKRAQGVSAITEQVSAVIHLQDHPERKGASQINIMKLRGQGRSRTISAQLMGANYPQLLNESTVDSDDQYSNDNDTLEAIVRAVADHCNQWRLAHPDISSGQLGIYYTGASISEISTAIKRIGFPLQDRKLRNHLRTLTTSNQLAKRGHTSDTAYTLPSATPRLDSTLDF